MQLRDSKQLYLQKKGIIVLLIVFFFLQINGHNNQISCEISKLHPPGLSEFQNSHKISKISLAKLSFNKKHQIDLNNFLKDSSFGYVEHSPIFIDGDEDFYTQAISEGWLGKGTPEDPYIITNYHIKSSLGKLIEIRNTNTYFIISDNLIEGVYEESDYGIYLENVAHGTIINTIIHTNWCGIWLNSSSYNVIANNTISENKDYGIWVANSVNNSIVNNNLFKNGYTRSIPYGGGIFIDSSRFTNFSDNMSYNNTRGVVLSSGNTINNTISRNLITNNSLGIDIWRVQYNTIFHNTITNNRQGIRFQYSTNNLVSNNNIEENYYAIEVIDGANNNIITNNTIRMNTYGYDQSRVNGSIVSYNTFMWNDYCIHNYIASHNTFTNNILVENSRLGIYLSQGINNTFSENIIYNHPSYGIYLLDADNSFIFYNDLIGNGHYFSLGISQAYDGGFENTFDYNFWAEWTTPDTDKDGIVDSPYKIAGRANTDSHPLVTPNNLISADYLSKYNVIFSIPYQELFLLFTSIDVFLLFFFLITVERRSK
ncbi:MAG: nitrous oxide reductase family maturation protein NosD [Promethearchaeota archaeon]